MWQYIKELFGFGVTTVELRGGDMAFVCRHESTEVEQIANLNWTDNEHVSMTATQAFIIACNLRAKMDPDFFDHQIRFLERVHEKETGYKPKKVEWNNG